MCVRNEEEEQKMPEGKLTDNVMTTCKETHNSI